MKTAQQIAASLVSGIKRNNAATGQTNRRLVQLGDGEGNIRPATLLTPRDVLYCSSLDANDRGVAQLHPSCPIPLDALDGYYGVEVWAANVAGSSTIYIVEIGDTALYATDGVTPSEQQVRDSAFPTQDRLAIMRLSPTADSSLSVLIDCGDYAFAYSNNDGTYSFFGTDTHDLSDPTDSALFTPVDTALAAGEHRIVGIAFDPVTAAYTAIPGAAATATGSLPARDEFTQTDYEAIDFIGYMPVGYVYTYFGQVAPFVEDDMLRIFDPRLVLKALTIIGNGDVVGPSSATDGHLALFDGPTGKLIKDGGPVPSGSYYQTVQGNGTPATQQPIMDFEDTATVTWTITNDGAGTRTKVKGTASGSGGGSALAKIPIASIAR